MPATPMAFLATCLTSLAGLEGLTPPPLPEPDLSPGRRGTGRRTPLRPRGKPPEVLPDEPAVVEASPARGCTAPTPSARARAWAAREAVQPVTAEDEAIARRARDQREFTARALVGLAGAVPATLPLVAWALDEPAPPDVEARYRCPSLVFDLHAGADTGASFPGARPLGQGRVTVGLGVFGADAQVDLAPSAVSTAAVHLLLRVPPRKHVEGALAVGYRHLSVDGYFVEGLSVGLPHRYVLWRDGARSFGLEVRPSLMVTGTGFELALEGHVVIPLFEHVHLRLGGRAFTVGPHLIAGGNGGLALGL